MTDQGALRALDEHARLTERMLRPSAAMSSFIGYHMREQVKESGARQAAVMFVPVLKEGEVPDADHGARMAAIIGRSLAKAVTYLVTPQMVAVMRDTYANADRVRQIAVEEVPSPAGFAWLGEPWLIGDAAQAFRVRALGWEFLEIRASDDDGVWRVVPSARITLWLHDEDIPSAVERGGAELGPLTLTHTMVMPLGLPFIDPPRSEDQESTESFLGLVHLLWIYLGMEVTAQERAGLPAAVRQRARRALRRPEVRVVLLRRVAGVTEPGESRDRFWSCRWPVQGHHRHRLRPADGHRAVIDGPGAKECAACGGLVSWVSPCLKGPAGLPLRVPSPVVMKLAR